MLATDWERESACFRFEREEKRRQAAALHSAGSEGHAAPDGWEARANSSEKRALEFPAPEIKKAAEKPPQPEETCTLT